MWLFGLFGIVMFPFYRAGYLAHDCVIKRGNDACGIGSPIVDDSAGKISILPKGFQEVRT